MLDDVTLCKIEKVHFVSHLFIKARYPSKSKTMSEVINIIDLRYPNNFKQDELWNNKIKDTLGLTKSKLMFDFSTCDEKQKSLMGNILFKDSTSIEYWLEYVKCVAEKNENFNSISRLLNIVFQMIDTVEDSSDEFIIDLYLFKANYLR